MLQFDVNCHVLVEKERSILFEVVKFIFVLPMGVAPACNIFAEIISKQINHADLG